MTAYQKCLHMWSDDFLRLCKSTFYQLFSWNETYHVASDDISILIYRIPKRVITLLSLNGLNFLLGREKKNENNFRGDVSNYIKAWPPQRNHPAPFLLPFY